MSVEDLNKSLSEPNLCGLNTSKTPPNFVSTRNKRRREEDDFTVELNKSKEEMKEMFSKFMSAQKSELIILTTNLKELHQTNNKIEASLTQLTNNMLIFKERSNPLSCRVKKIGNTSQYWKKKWKISKDALRKIALSLRTFLGNSMKHEMIL